MLKIEVARAGGPTAVEAEQWCLSYNESDVAAQAVIRDGLRATFPPGDTEECNGANAVGPTG